MHVGEAEVAALEFVDELFVLDPKEVQHCGVEVMHVDAALDDVVAVVVGRADDGAAFHAAAGEPQAEAAGVMIAPVIVRGDFPLAVGGASEFATPHDERVVEQAATFQVGDERGGSLVGLFALARDPAHDIAMLVPALMEKLDETDVALDEPPREQAVRSVGAGLFAVGAVELESFLGFAGEIGRLRHAGLHAEGHLGLRHAGVDFRVELLLGLVAVELAERVEHVAAHVRRDAFGIGEVKHRLLTRPELHALMFAGEKARTPQPRVKRLVARGIFRNEHDERREVVIERAEAVGGPRAHRGSPGHLVPGAEKSDRRIVVDRLGVHGADEAEVVGDFLRVRQRVADLHAAAAALGEIRE